MGFRAILKDLVLYPPESEIWAIWLKIRLLWNMHNISR